MTKHFKFLAAILLVLAGVITGCQKTYDVKDNEATALTGSVSGKYSPASAAASIVAVKNQGSVSTQAKLDSSNGFNISGLEAGNYTIRFTAMPGFAAPDSALVTLKAGEHFDMGTVLFKKTDSSGTGTSGSISGKISPAKAAAGILVTGIFGDPRYSAIPDANGNFKIDNITPGQYNVGFTAALGFTSPNNLPASVTAGKNTDVGGIVFNPIMVIQKAIDTIQGTVFFSTAQLVNDFITRANADSMIVITGSLWLSGQFVTPELAAALNKIMVIKQVLYASNAANTSLTFSALKELGQLYLNGATNLTSVDVSALKTITSGVLMYQCPALTKLKISALNQFAGSLTLNGTGFSDLSDFKSAMYKPFSFEIQNNPKLTSLAGLNFASDSVFDCTITYNPLLTTLNGLQGIKRFKNDALISNNPALQTLTGLDNIIVALHLTLMNNAQLNAVCGAKQLVNILKDAPPYQVRHTDQLTGRITYTTVQPLVASANGTYATRADLVTAAGQCR